MRTSFMPEARSKEHESRLLQFAKQVEAAHLELLLIESQLAKKRKEFALMHTQYRKLIDATYV